jgi:L-rhamnose mutarotase
MQRIAFKMKLFPGKEQEYKRRHTALWPELVELLKEAGISDYHIYLDKETDILFGSYLADNADALALLPNNPLMKKWWAYMAELMETNEDISPVSHTLEQMFYLP